MNAHPGEAADRPVPLLSDVSPCTIDFRMDTDQPTAPLVAVAPAEVAAALPSETRKLKYWEEKAGIAPIKSE